MPYVFAWFHDRTLHVDSLAPRREVGPADGNLVLEFEMENILIQGVSFTVAWLCDAMPNLASLLTSAVIMSIATLGAEA